MANSEAVFLKGKFGWVRHIRPDMAFEPHKWTVTLWPDGESLEKIKQLKKEGLQNHLKLDDDGQQYIQFSRKTEANVRGKKVPLAPPVVIDANKVPIDRPIGNGSDGIIELETYKHKTSVPGQFKKAARWSRMRVDNMIEFNPEQDFPDKGESIKAIGEEPEQLF